MNIIISNEITIIDPPPSFQKWIKENLTVDNPEYLQKLKLGLKLWNTPRKIHLYRTDGNKMILPFGVVDSIKELIKYSESVTYDLASNNPIEYNSDVSLYDYQNDAKNVMLKNICGILNAPAGSGKTRTATAMIFQSKQKTLWITHTKDLLNQAYSTAKSFVSEDLLGKITEGDVKIGRGITYATVQTLAKLDLQKYKYCWNMIVVDECHRIAGSELKRTQFSTVLNNLAAKRKYGLTATVHRADGMEKAMFSLIGNVKHIVPIKAVADKIMRVKINKVYTGCEFPLNCQMPDGTLNYAAYLTKLATAQDRNELIAKYLISNKEHFNLILSDRLVQFDSIIKYLPKEFRKQSLIISGTTPKSQREQGIEDMRQGKKHFLFASYRLAKEGLDIPRLDRLYLVTPQKDEAIVIQSVGRIARTFPNKEQPLCYDFVDDYRMSENAYHERCRSYKKCKCEFVEWSE